MHGRQSPPRHGFSGGCKAVRGAAGRGRGKPSQCQRIIVAIRRRRWKDGQVGLVPCRLPPQPIRQQRGMHLGRALVCLLTRALVRVSKQARGTGIGSDRCSYALGSDTHVSHWSFGCNLVHETLCLATADLLLSLQSEAMASSRERVQRLEGEAPTAPGDNDAVAAGT